MKKYIYTILASALFSISINAQSNSVGINNTMEDTTIPYTFPADNVSLDTYFTKRGIQVPQYDLQELSNPASPVDFRQDIANGKTVDGTLIFNYGTTHTRGYYMWVKDRWHLVMYKGTEPQVLTLIIPANIYLVPANSSIGAINTLSGFQMKDNSIDGASISSNGITLPAGKYSFRYAVDAFAGPQLSKNPGTTSVANDYPASNYYFSNRISAHSISSFLRKANGSAITGTQYITNMNDLSGNGRFLFYQGLFVFELTEPTTIQQTFQYTDGTSNRTLGITVRRDYSAVITRLPN